MTTRFVKTILISYNPTPLITSLCLQYLSMCVELYFVSTFYLIKQVYYAIFKLLLANKYDSFVYRNPLILIKFDICLFPGP